MSMENSSNKPVFFHLITGLQIGGAERMLARILPHLSEYRHVVVSLTGDGPMRQEYENIGVNVKMIGLRNPFDIGAFFRFRAIVKKHRPIVLTTYLIHADVVGRIWGKMLNIPHIVSSLRARFRNNNYLFFLLLARIFDFCVDRYIAVSEEVKKYYIKNLKFPKSKFAVIVNGLDEKIYRTSIDAEKRNKILSNLGIPNSSLIVGTVSQLRPEKAVNRLISAMQIVRKKRADAHCLIVGDGALQNELQKQTELSGMSDCVHFLGRRSDVPEILTLFDVFVLPSLFEGMSNALLEAMACGRAIVATDMAENRELITHNDGMLIDTSNSNILAETILELLSDDLRRQEIGNAARQKFVKNFILSDRINELKSFYNSILSRK